MAQKLDEPQNERLVVTLRVNELLDKIDERIAKSISSIPPKVEVKNLLKPEEVANMFSISEVTVHQWAKKKLIIPHHMNTRVYYIREELMDALKSVKNKKENES